MTHTVNFIGNYGTIQCDPTTGEVVGYVLALGEAADYADISRVDLAERRGWYVAHGVPMAAHQPDGDILDCGFWTLAGDYVEPENGWRTDRLTEVTP
jgi:hypothetical protein